MSKERKVDDKELEGVSGGDGISDVQGGPGSGPGPSPGSGGVGTPPGGGGGGTVDEEEGGRTTLPGPTPITNLE